MKINGITQGAFSEQVGCGWHKISRLVSTGAVKPIAQIGSQLFFSPDDVAKAKAAIAESKSAEETKYRPEWDAKDANGKNEFGGSFSAYVAFQKNVGGVQTFSRDGSNKVVSARANGRSVS